MLQCCTANTTLMKGSIKFLRLPEVIQKVGLKKTYIYQMIREGTFPKQIKVAPRAVVWNEYDIDQWQEGYIK